MSQEFGNKVVEAAGRWFAGHTVAKSGGPTANGNLNGNAKMGEKRQETYNLNGLTEEDVRDDGATMVISGAGGSVLSVRNRFVPL